MDVSLGVYLSPKLIEEFPKSTQDLIWLYKIKKELGSLSGIEYSLTDSERSFKKQYSLVTARTNPKIVKDNILYALGFLEIKNSESQRLLSYLPEDPIKERRYLDLVAQYGTFLSFVDLYKSFDHRTRPEISSFVEKAVREPNLGVLKGLFRLLPKEYLLWGKVWLLLSKIDQRVDGGLYKSIEWLESFYKELFELLGEDFVQGILPKDPREIPTKLLFDKVKSISTTRSDDIYFQRVKTILNNASLEVLKDLYPKLSLLGPRGFRFDKDADLSYETLEYLYERDGLKALHLGDQIKLKFHKRDWKSLELLLKTTREEGLVKDLFESALSRRDLSLENFETFTKITGKYLLFSEWEKVLLDEITKNSYSEKARILSELREGPLRNRDGVIRSLIKIGRHSNNEEALNVALRLLEGQKFDHRETQKILSVYYGGQIFPKILLAILEPLSPLDQAPFYAYKVRALNLALENEDFDTALQIALTWEDTLKDLDPKLLKVSQIREFLLREFPENFGGI